MSNWSVLHTEFQYNSCIPIDFYTRYFIYFTFQIEILLDVLYRKEKFPQNDIGIEFWPQWAGKYGLPCVTVNNSKV